MKHMKTVPLLVLAEWLSKNRVRLSFSTGRVTEVRLPVRTAKSAHIVDMGMGLDPGDGRDVSSLWLYSRGRILREGRHGVPMRS
jgi:hypothetical protein